MSGIVLLHYKKNTTHLVHIVFGNGVVKHCPQIIQKINNFDGCAVR